MKLFLKKKKVPIRVTSNLVERALEKLCFDSCWSLGQQVWLKKDTSWNNFQKFSKVKS